MAEKNSAAETVHPLPFEVADTNAKSPEESLFDLLGSDPDYVEDGTTEETDETESAEDADSSDEEDESDEDEDSEAEESEDDEEDHEDDGEEPDLFEVTLPGGEKEKVTLDELLKGYSRTKDYTRKTQLTAEERRALTVEKERTAQVREQYGQLLEQLDGALKSMTPAEPDWDKLRKENPAEFAAQWADYQRLEADRKAVEAERQRLQEDAAKDYQEKLAQHLADEQQKLVQAVPEFKDRKVAKQELAQIREFAQGLGYTLAELSGISDHRVVLILRDAMRYRSLSEGREKVREKAKHAKVLQPGARVDTVRKGKRSEFKRAKEQLTRSGRVSDAASAIFHMID